MPQVWSPFLQNYRSFQRKLLQGNEQLSPQDNIPSSLSLLFFYVLKKGLWSLHCAVPYSLLHLLVMIFFHSLPFHRSVTLGEGLDSSFSGSQDPGRSHQLGLSHPLLGQLSAFTSICQFYWPIEDEWLGLRIKAVTGTLTAPSKNKLTASVVSITVDPTNHESKMVSRTLFLLNMNRCFSCLYSLRYSITVSYLVFTWY